MSENDEPKQFFRHEKLDEDRLFVEVPAEQKLPYQERIPSGYDPMGEIYLRGRAYRSLSGGTIPWWVLITGWLVFGSPALLVLITAIASASFTMLPALAITAIPLLILWRGTLAKLSSTKPRRR
ncbi:MAG: hypothetical protein KME25_10030 [Symplocastrum torsivum CPER-KK1]|jgi:hypothetical protein|uniref:Uncharacterized protein n=1 Tax=Symplocastrum torsivum CPER-KK1 TaxID=450513 RepID=A0A951PLA6_9CYAN|nr:hypothetical protein [Symplocastrum torsivum CPER-KK1]